jgi:hypothetical protein
MLADYDGQIESPRHGLDPANEVDRWADHGEIQPRGGGTDIDIGLQNIFADRVLGEHVRQYRQALRDPGQLVNLGRREAVRPVGEWVAISDGCGARLVTGRA